MAGIIETILSVISPREAEAKIVGSSEAMKLIAAIYKAAEQEELKGDYLSKMYRQIITAADKHPKTVSVHQAEGLQDVYGSAAEYNTVSGEMLYDPKYSEQDMSNVISHELLHFLNSVSGKPEPTAKQHELIKFVLGTDVYKPASELKGYQQPSLSKEQTDMLILMIGQ